MTKKWHVGSVGMAKVNISMPPCRIHLGLSLYKVLEPQLIVFLLKEWIRRHAFWEFMSKVFAVDLIETNAQFNSLESPFRNWMHWKLQVFGYRLFKYLYKSIVWPVCAQDYIQDLLWEIDLNPMDQIKVMVPIMRVPLNFRLFLTANAC